MAEKQRNVGRALRALATALFWLWAIFTVIIVLGVLREAGKEAGLLALLTFLAGIMTAFISSTLLYGIGELVENSTAVKRLQSIDEKPEEDKTKST